MQSRDCASYVECIIIAHHIRKCLVSRIWCSLRVWYQYWPGWLTWRQLSPILIFVGYHLCERESQCRERERSTTSLLCDNVGSRTGTWSSPTKMWLWYSLTQPMHQLSSAYSFCICSTVNNQILKGGGFRGWCWHASCWCRGYNIGVRFIEDFLAIAHNQQGWCHDLGETADVLAKVSTTQTLCFSCL